GVRKLVGGEQLAPRLRRDHQRRGVVRDVVNLAVGIDPRRVGPSDPREALRVDLLARGRVQAHGRAALFVEPVQVAGVVDRRIDPRIVAAGPEFLDLPRATGLHGDRPAGAARDGVDDAVVGYDAGADVAVVIALAAPQLLARAGVDADNLARLARHVQHQFRPPSR